MSCKPKTKRVFTELEALHSYMKFLECKKGDYETDNINCGQILPLGAFSLTTFELL